MLLQSPLPPANEKTIIFSALETRSATGLLHFPQLVGLANNGVGEHYSFHGIARVSTSLIYWLTGILWRPNVTKQADRASSYSLRMTVHTVIGACASCQSYLTRLSPYGFGQSLVILNRTSIRMLLDYLSSGILCVKLKAVWLPECTMERRFVSFIFFSLYISKIEHTIFQLVLWYWHQLHNVKPIVQLTYVYCG